MFGVEAYPDLFQKAASLLQSLTANRPLVDGNKRTAWLCTVVLLDLDGVGMVAIDQDRAYDLVIEIASGKLEEVPLIADALRALHDGR